MKGIIDFHTHAFPDALAEKAVKLLEAEGGIPARLDGTIASLLKSMDECGIEKSVVCSIATKPSQFEPIMRWSAEIKSDRIIPLPSVHPDDTEILDKIGVIKAEGFKGVKMHPYYQGFNLNDEKMMSVYEKICRENLIFVSHTGFDFAFERIKKSDPVKIVEIHRAFPGLKFVATHMGAWEDWSEVERLMAGKNIYMEISFSLEFMEKERAKNIIMKHPPEYIMFGTDSPWTGQKETLDLLEVLSLEPALKSRILRENALDLLNSV
ncbi:MAG: amidohydrolase [Candidatus Omnitrophica bacterium]|nr:amidohydrolase [Candidatus Omnitrophota bacterium]